MSRIPSVTYALATPAQTELFASVQKAMGAVPNLISTMGHSVAATKSYLAFSQALSHGILSGPIREQVALTVAEANGCNYCLAAHTALGSRAGLTAEQIAQARRGLSTHAHTAALLALARLLVEQRGRIDDAALATARLAGVTDAEITEVIANVALNVFTNYFNHVADTPVDFPAAPVLAA